jgi:hypothetical protein
MNTAPGADPSESRARGRRRLLVIGVVLAIVLALVVAAAGWYYFYGGTAPEAPTIENALQQLLPSEPPE